MMRERFDVHAGIAAALLRDNVDTDQIIPSREMKAVSREGLGDGLFAGWRYVSAGSRELNPDFVLNKPNFLSATVLIAGENFGCGSSREHAVWALAEFGFKAIIAKSFGAIFRGNCVRNGVLPIILSGEDVDWIAEQSLALLSEVRVDLPAQTVSCSGREFDFEIDAFAKRMLIEGLDPIGLTLAGADKIAAFHERDKLKRPWVYAEA